MQVCIKTDNQIRAQREARDPTPRTQGGQSPDPVPQRVPSPDSWTSPLLGNSRVKNVFQLARLKRKGVGTTTFLHHSFQYTSHTFIPATRPPPHTHWGDAGQHYGQQMQYFHKTALQMRINMAGESNPADILTSLSRLWNQLGVMGWRRWVRLTECGDVYPRNYRMSKGGKSGHGSRI